MLHLQVEVWKVECKLIHAIHFPQIKSQTTIWIIKIFKCLNSALAGALMCANDETK